MKISLIGMGCGPDTWTAEAAAAIGEADLLIGARRILSDLPGHTAECIEEYRPEAVAELLSRSGADRVCVLLSGDSGFFSGAAGLLPLLKEPGMRTEVLPGISSLQVLAARLGRPWQDWRLCSAHGAACDPVFEVMRGKPVLFLTSGGDSLRDLCARLTEAGLGELPVTIAENLGQPEERITRTAASEAAAGAAFSPLNVLLAEPAPRSPVRVPGIPDEAFLRDRIPMTKQEVRAAVLAKLAVRPEDVCWDIGAGTGSVSVEMALCSKAVWAVERNRDALELAAKNREKFGAWNLRLKEGEAPEALADLPKPDAVFVGGSGGRLREILRAVREANPLARVVVSAIALETLHQAAEELEHLGYETEISQISVSHVRKAGDLHLLLAQNPVFLISADNEGRERGNETDHDFRHGKRKR